MTGRRAPGRGLAWYLTSLSFFTVPAGVHAVLFPWLVTIHLGEPAERVGIAQMAATLPALALILLGGALADRFDPRRLLVALHLVAALPPLALAAAIGAGRFDYGMALGYALSYGAVNALTQPARDSMLSAVAGAEVQRAVALVIGAQFAVQLFGFLLASTANMVGPAPLLLAQGSIVALGLFATLRLPARARVTRPRDPVLTGIAEGLQLVLRSERMLAAVVTVGGMGLFFGGAYSVLVPLYVREFYGGAAGSLALAFAAFIAGTMVSTFGLVALGGVQRSGRWLMLSMANGVAVLALLLLPLPLWAFFVVIFAWGMGGGIAMSLSRSLVQEAAPASHRARVMAVYQFGNLGSLPLGALLTGYAVEWTGAGHAALIPCVGVALLLVGLALRTSLWQLRAAPADTAQA